MVPFVVALAPGCAPQQPDMAARDHHGEERLGTVQSALSAEDPVSAAVTDKGCTTSVVKGLATQLVEEIQCLRPGTLASFEGAPGFELGSAVFPWLQVPAQQALLAAQKRRGATMSINSALRTLPQQYLLYRWYKTGRCGIGLAAAPGRSNHEEALAVDIDDNAGWRDAMKAHSLIWLGSSDPVHFDYKGAGAVDIGGLSVLAFQRLWNRNHPEDRIEEDSDYGPATEERLSKSPVGGFAKGADCSVPAPDVSAPPIPPEVDGGTAGGGLLGASGSRDLDGDGGCSVGRASSAGSGQVSLLVAVAAGALAVRRPAGRRGRARQA